MSLRFFRGLEFGDHQISDLGSPKLSNRQSWTSSTIFRVLLAVSLVAFPVGVWWAWLQVLLRYPPPELKSPLQFWLMLQTGGLTFGLYTTTFLGILGTLFSVRFIVELVAELNFRCWEKIKGIRGGGRVLETTPLLSTRLLDDGDRDKRSQTVFEYHAVDIAALDTASMRGGVRVSALPTCIVRLPFEDVSKVAVLSWRWDFEKGFTGSPSLNMAHAVQYAKSNGIQYLFIDIISIDQTLPSAELIASVARFGSLYAKIPVIVTYDDLPLKFEHIMARPWILKEIQSMFYNPHEVVYVGHQQQGTFIEESVYQLVLQRLPRSQTWETSFAKHLQKAWESDFATTALQILNGNVQMTDVYDFKYILPKLVEVLTAAEQLEQNDYLLMVVLLASTTRYGAAPTYLVDDTFVDLPYSRFQIRSSAREHRNSTVDEHGSFETREHEDIHEIYLDEEKLGEMRCTESEPRICTVFEYTLTFEPEMERHVLEMLGLGSEAYSRYLRVDLSHRQSNARIPDVKVVESRVRL